MKKKTQPEKPAPRLLPIDELPQVRGGGRTRGGDDDDGPIIIISPDGP